MTRTSRAHHATESRQVCRETWIDRCYLPLLVGVVVAVSVPAGAGGETLIALTDGDRIAVAGDLGSAVEQEVEAGELLCLRLDGEVAVTIDFADGRTLASRTLSQAARRVRSA